MRVAGNRRSSCSGPGLPPTDMSRLKGKHFAGSEKEGREKGRCKVCGSRKTNEGKTKDIKTANKCLHRNVFLCERACFTDYHTKAKLKRNHVKTN